MRAKMVLEVLLSVIVVSCSSTRDITGNSGGMTDYIVGQAYRLKQSVFLQGGVLGRFWDKRLEEKFRNAKPSWIEGIVEAGTPLVIRKIEVSRAPELGTWTDVYAEIVAGKFNGKVVQASSISKQLPTGATIRDPTMLEPVESQAK